MNKISDLSAGKSFWEIALLVTLSLAVLFSQISVSIVQSLLTLSLVAWIVLLVRKERRFAAPVFFWPLLVYAGFSLLASAFSVNPGVSFRDDRELLLFVVVPLVFTAFKKVEETELIVAALLVSGFINVLYSIGYGFFKAVPGQRVEGFMSHYMTQAGLLVLFGSVALGYVFFGRGRHPLLWAGSLVLAFYALVLTLTRSGWIGLAVAAAVIVLLWKPKTIVLLPILAALLFFAAPRTVRERVTNSFNTKDPMNRTRIEYARAGAKIIADYPLLGCGPNTVKMVFQNPKYGLSETAKRNVHLHSDIMQIAAERGIVTLLAWLAFVVSAFLALLKLARGRTTPGRPLAAGALAALTAFFAAGFFEFNFGDSEVSTLLLFILTLPFAVSRLR
jgi:O-antigen ligase